MQTNGKVTKLVASTRHCSNVVTTLLTSKQRPNNVVTTSKRRRVLTGMVEIARQVVNFIAALLTF